MKAFHNEYPEAASVFLKSQFPTWNPDKESYELGLSRYFISLKLAYAEGKLSGNKITDLDTELSASYDHVKEEFVELSPDLTFSPVQPEIDHVVAMEIGNYTEVAKLLTQLDPYIVGLIKASYIENPNASPNAAAFIQFVLEQFYSYANPGQDAIFVRNLLDYAFKNLPAEKVYMIAHSVGIVDFSGIICNTFSTSPLIDPSEQLTPASFNNALIDELLAMDPARTAMFVAKNILVPFAPEGLSLEKSNEWEKIFAHDLLQLTSDKESLRMACQGLFMILHPATNRAPGCSTMEALGLLLNGIKPLVDMEPQSHMLIYLLTECPQVQEILKGILTGCFGLLREPALSILKTLGEPGQTDTNKKQMLKSLLNLVTDNAENIGKGAYGTIGYNVLAAAASSPLTLLGFGLSTSMDVGIKAYASVTGTVCNLLPRNSFHNLLASATAVARDTILSYIPVNAPHIQGLTANAHSTVNALVPYTNTPVQEISSNGLPSRKRV